MADDDNRKWFVYCLSCDGKTYVGSTHNLEHRLDQHNGKKAGGARSTKRRRKDGKRCRWKYAFTIEFGTRTLALQAEWRLHHMRNYRKQVPNSMSRVQKRLYEALYMLNKIPQASSKAVPWAELPTPPVVRIMRPTLITQHHRNIAPNL